MKTPTCFPEGGCITCSDAVESVRVESVSANGDTGMCIDGCGARMEVMLDLLPGVTPGAEVLVHAGVALLAVRPPAGGEAEERA